jgi:hypothetical protein
MQFDPSNRSAFVTRVNGVAVVSLFLCALAVECLGADPAPPDAARPAAARVVLDTDGPWRFRPSFGTELCRLASGKLVCVDPVQYRDRAYKMVKGRKTAYAVLRTHPRARLWPPPPTGWAAADFDDGDWAPLRGPLFVVGYYKGTRARYRSVPFACLRGRFHVEDPARAAGLRLTVCFRGGAVVYLNGRELARAHMPKGPVRPDTPAEDYPVEAFVDERGRLLDRKFPDPKHADRYEMRRRWIRDLPIPAAALREGVNVLAIELHRPPAPDVLFLGNCARQGKVYSHAPHVKTFSWWSRIGLESVQLTAPAGAAVRPGAGDAAGQGGARVSAWPAHVPIVPGTRGDPNEPPRPVRLCGARNGAYSAALVVAGDRAVRGVSARCTALRGQAGARIGAAAVQVRYGVGQSGWGPAAGPFEGLEESPPQQVPVDEQSGRACQLIWITVRVPADAKPGAYEGTLTVAADGRQLAAVPVRLQVVDWTLPDATDFFAHVGAIQSPGSVAMRYKVPMWSQRHWALIERSFALLGRIGVDVIYVPAVRQTHLGNQHSMIRYVRQSDGRLEPDFSIAERYLDVAVRHLGKVPVVCLYCWETFDSSGRKHFGHYARKDGPIRISILDPKTGALTESEAPAWGTPQCRAFWKPVIDGMKKRLAARGMARSLLIGVAGDFEPTGAAYDDLRAASGGLGWVFHSHVVRHTLGPEGKDHSGYIASGWGGHTSHVDPDFGRGYGWKNPFTRVMTRWFPRSPVEQRLCLEALCTSRISPRRKLDWQHRDWALHGIGRIGADFWPVLEGKASHAAVLAGRYPHSQWGQLGLRHSLLALLGYGREGAIGTVKLEMLRQNLQELEARIFLEKVLADEAKRKRLGEAAAARVQALLDERTRACLRTYAERDAHAAVGLPVARMSKRLYETAAEVAAKLNQ